MIRLYFMRHAESEANRLNVLASQLQYPLSSRGMSDAELIAERFSTLDLPPVQRIITSPLIRARQTAMPFERRFGVQASIHEALIEQHIGTFAGMACNAAEAHPGYQHDKTQRWDWHPPGGGESYSEIAARLMPFFSQIEEWVAAQDTRTTLIVSHAVTLRLIYAIISGMIPQYPTWMAGIGELWSVDFQRVGEPAEITRHTVL